MSDQAQYYTISLGAQDTDVDTLVIQLQQRLVELGYMDNATGYFGEETQGAVTKFQKLNSLPETGSIDQNTREMLYSPNAAANTFSYGEQSDEVLEYQKRLQKLGYLTTEPDGSFGNDTREAVRRFQEANGLTVDGNIGPTTADALMSAGAQGDALSIGDQGVQVKNIQERLKELGYFKADLTGYFGEVTETAVRSFQWRNGLSVDGRVGPNTLRMLNSDSAKKSTGVNITGANVESLIAVAKSKLGARYVGGGKGPTVFDCSGFAYWCLNQIGVHQSYMTSYTWRSCTRYTRITSKSQIKRGDIIIYAGHVAIALGNGYQIDASSSHGKVVQRRMSTSLKFICAYRIF
jgi:peptidoglycan hydrolase-like protein with peptidoglycan-binding domain